MTDSNGDLVARLKGMFRNCLQSPPFETSIPAEAEALEMSSENAANEAIATVLDDLTQDAKAMALDRTLDLLDIKRKELGL